MEKNSEGVPGLQSFSLAVGLYLPNMLKQVPVLDRGGVVDGSLLKTFELSPFPSLACWAHSGQECCG